MTAHDGKLFLTTLSFTMISGLKVKHTQLNPRLWVHAKWRGLIRLGAIKLLYLSLVALSFYVLFISRANEVHTVWEVMHPTFIPIFFAMTFLLIVIVLSSENVESKILFTVIHSIVSHTFFAIIFPAGDVGGQQIMLGRTRLLFDNVILHGFGQPQKHILSQIYYWFRGDNFQAALSIVFARMFGIDVYWIHILLVPILWGTFVPIAMFIVTKLLGQSDSVSVLSSLMLSVFPLTIYWGNISVPNSLGFIFFLFSLTSFLRYLHSNESKVSFLMMLVLSFVSFLTHFLTGIISFSLLLLAIALRKYEKQRKGTPTTAKLSLVIAFIFSGSLLPFSLVYHKLFYPLYTYFTLEKISALSAQEIFLSFTFGEYLNYSPGFLLAMLLGPLLGFTGMLYMLYRNSKKKLGKHYSICLLFLSMGFLLFLAEYRILRLFMIGTPFQEKRLWVFRDFLAVPFVAMFVASVADGVIALLPKITLTVMSRLQGLCIVLPSIRIDVRSKATRIVKVIRVGIYIILFVLLSGWIMASVYYAYPRWAPLQTTSYELEAAKYIDASTTETYIVVSDQWVIYAGAMVVGIGNPRAYYFSSADPKGVALFIKMKNNPSNETMAEATKINNATVTYFIIEKPRLGTEEYNRIIQQARENGLPTYKAFEYEGEERLTIFYHKKPSTNN